MSQSCSCPVCGRQGLPPDCAVCPQCDSDLTCFQVLDALAAAPAQPVTAPARPRFPWLAAAGLLLTTAVLALLIFLVVTGRLLEPRPAVTATETRQEQQTVPVLREQKIHIDAQIRIVDERRQDMPLPDAAKSSLPEDSSAGAAQEKAADQSQSVSELLPLPDVENDAAAKSSLPENSSAVAAQKKAADQSKSVSELLPLPEVENNAAAKSSLLEDSSAVAAQEKAADQSQSVSELLPLPDVENNAAAKSSLLEKSSAVAAHDFSSTANRTVQKGKNEKAAEHAEEDEVRQIDIVELSTPPMKKAVAAPITQEPVPPSKPSELPVITSSSKKRLFKHASTAVKTPVKKTRQAAAKTVTLAPTAAVRRKPKPVAQFIFYHAEKKETVWDIAQRFYGDRKYYPVLMELNPQIRSGIVKSGSTIRLFTRLRAAAALYHRKTERRNGLLLWKYKVRTDETWQSIYARFFPPRYSGMVFYPENQQVAPGTTVRIVLH